MLELESSYLLQDSSIGLRAREEEREGDVISDTRFSPEINSLATLFASTYFVSLSMYAEQRQRLSVRVKR